MYTVSVSVSGFGTLIVDRPAANNSPVANRALYSALETKGKAKGKKKKRQTPNQSPIIPINLTYIRVSPSPPLLMFPYLSLHLSLQFHPGTCALLVCMQTKLFLFMFSFGVHLSQLMP